MKESKFIINKNSEALEGISGLLKVTTLKVR